MGRRIVGGRGRLDKLEGLIWHQKFLNCHFHLEYNH